jgi:amidohydrolase
VPGIDVVALRRDLHRHPELAYAEHRTTGVIVDQLRHLGLAPKVLPSGTGVVCDVPALTSTDAAVVALRADIDALPVSDLKEVPYRSVHDGVCHGCGHDAHTAILLGAAAELVSEPVAATVRLLFQPAEETVPGGAVSVLSDGVLDGVSQIYALHCDPRIETGRVGLRVGPITAACDHVEVTLSGPGGHTARPHLTSDVVYAAGLLITELPGVLSRRVDPRAALSLVWGAVQAGHAANAIPTTGALRGTVRVLDADAWDGAEDLVASLVEQLVAATGVAVRISYVRGVPPVVNHPAAVQVQKAAVTAALGAEAVTDTAQSMGGEDFAWYLRAIPGALARLGVRAPGTAPFDLHQGTFDIDEAALQVGVRYTVALAAAAASRSLTQ